jgi:hypothetical protein
MRKMCKIIQLTTYVWPSVCGWKDVDLVSLVSNIDQRLDQNVLRNLLSLFEMIDCVLEKQDRGNKKHRRHTIQERHRFTWFTQCGLRPPEKLLGPSFIIIQQMKGYNLQKKPVVTSSSFSHSLLSQNTIFTLVHSRNTFPS